MTKERTIYFISSIKCGRELRPTYKTLDDAIVRIDEFFAKLRWAKI